MSNLYSRRGFTGSILLAGAGTTLLPFANDKKSKPVPPYANDPLKLSLNAYSFNGPLTRAEMSLDDLLDFCASTGFDAVDVTGYYFPGYPSVPSDEVIYHIKRKAFRLGLGISGTGVRNDFTWPDSDRRAKEKQLVKDWIVVAEKLGAPLLRIFAGNQLSDNIDWNEKAKWIADDIRECAEFGKAHGVMMALQNHYDFLKTPDQVERILSMIGSEWTGLLLDIGSYRSSDPYKDVAQTARYAISWQLKEKVYLNDKQVDTDYTKILAIVRQCGYRGYLPLETLGEGDPGSKVKALLMKVRSALELKNTYNK